MKRLARHLQAGRVGVHVAALPVQGEEALVDLLEQGPQPQVAVDEVRCALDIAETTFKVDRLARCDRPLDHADFKPAVAAQLHLVA